MKKAIVFDYLKQKKKNYEFRVKSNKFKYLLYLPINLKLIFLQKLNLNLPH